MKPSPTLCFRLRFTTKQVGRGFYRGTGTGAMGAHNEYGGYLVDWRKVRHFNVPDLKGFRVCYYSPRRARRRSAKLLTLTQTAHTIRHQANR
jgi:hypothetical protein